MKILKVEFENINSLAGKWKIDFENKDFANTGMFCITGPTGSGKTSILDAICLAFYGKTPRQEKVNVSTNEIMTKGTLGCYSKVTFENHGAVYSACWQQHRASGSKRLQGFEWTLTNANGNTEESLSNQKKIEEKMSDIIGLDYVQFTRSMMLAQGEFNTFLKCDETDRAKILEKLAGDSIYRKIATAVYDLYKKAGDSVKAIEQKIGDTHPLDEDSLKILLENIESKEKEKDSLGKEVEHLGKIRTWFETLHGIEHDRDEANKAHDTARQAKEIFAPQKKKLENALRAQNVEANYTAFHVASENLDKDKSNLSENRTKLESAKKKLDEATTAFNTANENAESLKKAYQDAEPLWTQVAELDVQISNAKLNFEGATQTANKISDDVGKTERNISELETKITEVVEKLKRVDDYIASHSQDSKLIELLPEIKAKQKEANSHLNEIKKLEDEIKKTNEVLKQETIKIATHEKEIAELQQEKERIVQNDIPVIVAELRSRLSEGGECPVCGSKEHPACHHDSKAIAGGTEALGNFADTLRNIDEKITAIRGTISICEGKRSAAEMTIREKLSKKDAEENELSTAQAALDEMLKPWNDSVKDKDSLATELDKRNQIWTKAQNAKIDLNGNLNTSNSNLQLLQENLTKEKNDFETAKAKCAECESSYKILVDKRQKLFGDKNVDIERKNAANARDAAEAKAKLLKVDEQTIRDSKIGLEKSVTELESSIHEQEEKLVALRNNFNERLNSNGFTDEQDFLAARLDEKTREQLANQEREIEKAVIAAETSIKNASKRLNEHSAKRDFSETEEETLQKTAQAKETREKLVSDLNELIRQKKNDDECRIKTAALEIEREAALEKFAKWERLQDWFVGGGNKNDGTGNYFVKFIQEITLRNLLSIANGHLRNMCPRYELMVKDNSLDIQLLDHDNFDAIRPVSNISGGEGFLVSLSLALAISTFASKNVSIDSMFLDEGFGTLDSKILQDTITVLEKLQKERGKLLGVITHVDQIKMGIPTQVNVTPQGRGRSILHGAGVTHLV